MHASLRHPRHVLYSTLHTVHAGCNKQGALCGKVTLVVCHICHLSIMHHIVVLHAGLLVGLTAELVKRSSKDNAVIVTWASSAYLDFLRNWVHYITSWDVDNILIGETSPSLPDSTAL